MKKNGKIVLFILSLTIFSCASPPPVREEPGMAEKEAPAAEAEAGGPPPVPEVPKADYLTIVAAGDNLYHDVMIRDGEEGDYEAAYTEIRPLVEKADVAFINQETLLAGADFGFSGYPRFNTPQALGRAIAAAGFNVVNHATNHIMDKGEKAVFATMDFWDTIPGVSILGIHRSEDDRRRPLLVKKNNISLGFLSYTYGTNGIPVPADKPYLVSLIDTEIMAREIDALRPLCDVLVVSMHWGEEYLSVPSDAQKKLAAFLAEHQVDLVIGHHPHVIQPIEYIARPDGKSMLCFYSLGNLISAQARLPTLLGALAFIRIEKIPAGPGETAAHIDFMEAGAIPVVTHYEKNYTNFRIYPLYTYTDELAAKHRVNQQKKELTMDYLTSLASAELGGKEILAMPGPDSYR